MGWFDALSAGAGCVDPGRASQQAERASQSTAGAGQQIEGRGLDGVAVNANGGEALLDILADLRGGPGAQTDLASNARKQGAVLA
jgi:hypothetical protein